MTATVPTNEPTELRAGTTWQWRREDLTADYPASTWTLKYWFKLLTSASANFSITATADGDNFEVDHAAATSQSYAAGDYSWVAVVTSGSDVFEVDSGVLKVLPRYDQATSLDDRSHARTMLDAIEALLENRSTLDQQEYTINNRSLKRLTVEELMKWRDYYRAEVYAETQLEAARNGKKTGFIGVRFS